MQYIRCGNHICNINPVLGSINKWVSANQAWELCFAFVSFYGPVLMLKCGISLAARHARWPNFILLYSFHAAEVVYTPSFSCIDLGEMHSLWSQKHRSLRKLAGTWRAVCQRTHQWSTPSLDGIILWIFDFSFCLHLALVTAFCDVLIHFHQSKCPFCSAIKVISSKLAGGLNLDGFYCSRLSILKQKNITMDNLYVLATFLFNLDV